MSSNTKQLPIYPEFTRINNAWERANCAFRELGVFANIWVSGPGGLRLGWVRRPADTEWTLCVRTVGIAITPVLSAPMFLRTAAVGLLPNLIEQIETYMTVSRGDVRRAAEKLETTLRGWCIE